MCAPAARTPPPTPTTAPTPGRTDGGTGSAQHTWSLPRNSISRVFLFFLTFAYLIVAVCKAGLLEFLRRSLRKNTVFSDCADKKRNPAGNSMWSKLLLFSHEKPTVLLDDTLSHRKDFTLGLFLFPVPLYSTEYVTLFKPKSAWQSYIKIFDLWTYRVPHNWWQFPLKPV